MGQAQKQLESIKINKIKNKQTNKYKQQKNNQESYPVHPNVLNMFKSGLTNQGKNKFLIPCTSHNFTR